MADTCHDTENLSDRRLLAAMAVNLLLTLVEVVGGILSGSLALVADALHNFGDCGSLLIALIARRVARKPADTRRTFGYRRAEIVGALINLTILIVVAVYLLFEAIRRYFDPQPIEGWTVIVVASVALVVDVVTAALLYSMSKGSLNVRAAFLHNVIDALASVGVILVGVCVLLWQFNAADLLITLVIAGYILWQSFRMLKQCIAILMNSAPAHIDLDELVREVGAIDGVVDLHHVHLWNMDEHHVSLEAHFVVATHDLSRLERIKTDMKALLCDKYHITHSTLEFEFPEDHQDAVKHDTSIIPPH